VIDDGTPEGSVEWIPLKNMEPLKAGDLLFTTPPAQPAQPTVVQDWMKPSPNCDKNCMLICTHGFTKFPECVKEAQCEAQPDPTCKNCGDGLVGDKLDGALCCDCAYRPEEQGWMRVIDEEMVGAHLGVAHPADSYDEAKQKLNSLICWHVSVATDSAIGLNGLTQSEAEATMSVHGLSDSAPTENKP
jgi:hypothetical protein